MTLGFTIPFNLKEHFSFTQLLARTAQQTHRLAPPAAQDDLGEDFLGPCATALGFTTGLWLVAVRAERVVRGAVDGSTVRDWLAAVNDGVPANAVVIRPATGFEIPKGAGSPLILTVMLDPGFGCCFKLWGVHSKNQYPTGQAPHGGRRRSDRRRKHHHVGGWTRLEPPGEYPLHSSELQF